MCTEGLEQLRAQVKGPTGLGILEGLQTLGLAIFWDFGVKKQ